MQNFNLAHTLLFSGGAGGGVTEINVSFFLERQRWCCVVFQIDGQCVSHKSPQIFIFLNKVLSGGILCFIELKVQLEIEPMACREGFAKYV